MLFISKDIISAMREGGPCVKYDKHNQGYCKFIVFLLNSLLFLVFKTLIHL